LLARSGADLEDLQLRRVRTDIQYS